MKKFLLLFISILTFSFLFTTNKTYAQEYLQGETWILNEKLMFTGASNFSVNFISNGNNYTEISIITPYYIEVHYNNTKVAETNPDTGLTTWIDQAYRIITFETPPTGDLLTWLEATAVKVLVPNDGYDEGYQDGYDEGYQDGFIAGEKSKIAKNNESFYKNIALWIPAVITVVALASIISYFGIKRKNE